jgi:hypothetical protein
MVIDIGLRLEDVQKWNLPAEDVINDSDPTDNLVKNGATAEEVAFIRGAPIAGSGRKQKYKGRRVELNAFTSDQFVQWLEGKLAEHGVEKVIPEESTLERAYRRAAGIKRCQATLDTAFSKIEAYAAGIAVPKDLAERVRLQLAQAPEQSWDDVIAGLVPPVMLDE